MYLKKSRVSRTILTLFLSYKMLILPTLLFPKFIFSFLSSNTDPKIFSFSDDSATAKSHPRTSDDFLFTNYITSPMFLPVSLPFTFSDVSSSISPLHLLRCFFQYLFPSPSPQIHHYRGKQSYIYIHIWKFYYHLNKINFNEFWERLV